MDNEEIEELFGPLRVAGWNPRMIDRSVIRYDNSVAAGYPTDIGDVLCEDYDAPHGEVNIHTKFQVDVRGDSMVGANIESGDTLTVLAGVKPLLPGHAHLPVAQELQRMAVMSFDKPVRLWDENNAPVSRGRFKDYKRIADQMGELLKVA